MTRYFKPGEYEEDLNKGVGKELDPYLGPAPVSFAQRKRFKRTVFKDQHNLANAKLAAKLRSAQREEHHAARQAARHELLLTEEAGFIETEEGEESWKISQNEIADASDIATANKKFDLRLDQFGPYRIDYTRNGRYLLLGGHMGHVAAFNWVSKSLMCEINVMETVNDIKWLHTENLFAAAQRKWVYVYDNQGVEIHCLKSLYDVTRLDFLPYHFLLVSGSTQGFLSYLDISVGKIITSFPTKQGKINVLSHNPSNAVVLIGHNHGTVCMYSPNQKEPLVKMLCHNGPIRSLAVDPRGNYVATSSNDRFLRIFDLRNFKLLSTYNVAGGSSNLDFSQRGLLAATRGDVVDIYKDPCNETIEKPYLSHRLNQRAQDLQFCPYEDILGVGSSNGFSSIIVPGAGEPNYDTYEMNPYRSKTQRREWEVKALLEKIQPELISLDPMQITKVDQATAEQLEKDNEERLGYKPEPLKFVPRLKKKGKSKASNLEKRKTIVRGMGEREKKIQAKNEEIKLKKQEKKTKKRKLTDKPNLKTKASEVETSANNTINDSISSGFDSVLSRFAKKAT